jgi:hypothetical protein
VARQLATDQPRRAIRLNPDVLDVTKTAIAPDTESSEERTMIGARATGFRSREAMFLVDPPRQFG